MITNKDKTIDWLTSTGLDFFSNELVSGKVIVGPSDTVCGFYAIPTYETFQRLNELKNRCKKPYLLLIQNQSLVAQYSDQYELILYKKLQEKCWPGPLTIIMKAKSDVPKWLVSEQGTIAVRVPSHPQLNQILARVPVLFSTSANVSGEPVPAYVKDINPSILNNVDWIVSDDQANLEHKITPSTIVDISSGACLLVREGIYSKEFLLSLLHVAW